MRSTYIAETLGPHYKVLKMQWIDFSCNDWGRGALVSRFSNLKTTTWIFLLFVGLASPSLAEIVDQAFSPKQIFLAAFETELLLVSLLPPLSLPPSPPAGGKQMELLINPGVLLHAISRRMGKSESLALED